jgi:hypothetical protein
MQNVRFRTRTVNEYRKYIPQYTLNPPIYFILINLTYVYFILAVGGINKKIVSNNAGILDSGYNC